MKVFQTDFHGDHNLGLFGKASDKYCIVGNFIQEKTFQNIEEVLRVKPIKLTIANTDLIGIFCCINSNGILIPKIAKESEIEKFKVLKKEFGIELKIIKSRFTALGNLILCNDNGAVLSDLFSKKDKREIEECLGVESEYGSVAGMSIVGSCGVASNRGCLLHRDANEKEIENVEKILKVDVDIGTANFGSPFVGSCCLVNSSGGLVGESTTGPEIGRLMETLGFT
jgi:translation initiation factor 6